MNNFKHELHEQKLAHHFDISADLFFCLARVSQDFKKIWWCIKKYAKKKQVEF